MPPILRFSVVVHNRIFTNRKPGVTKRSTSSARKGLYQELGHVESAKVGRHEKWRDPHTRGLVLQVFKQYTSLPIKSAKARLTRTCDLVLKVFVQEGCHFRVLRGEQGPPLQDERRMLVARDLVIWVTLAPSHCRLTNNMNELLKTNPKTRKSSLSRPGIRNVKPA